MKIMYTITINPPINSIKKCIYRRHLVLEDALSERLTGTESRGEKTQAEF